MKMLSLNNQLFANHKLVLHSAEGILVLPLGEVICLESDGCYTTFFTTQTGRIVVARRISEFEYLTTGYDFFRAHQSHLVNLNFVRQLLREDGGYIVLNGGMKVPLARRRKEAFLKLLDGGK